MKVCGLYTDVGTTGREAKGSGESRGGWRMVNADKKMKEREGRRRRDQDEEKSSVVVCVCIYLRV